MEIWVRLYSLINCSSCRNKKELTSLWASAGRLEFGRVRLPLPTRTGRMGKGILDQDGLFPPTFRSGQLLPVKQMKGCINTRKTKDRKFYCIKSVIESIPSRIEKREQRNHKWYNKCYTKQQVLFKRLNRDKFEEHLHRQTLSGIEG